MLAVETKACLATSRIPIFFQAFFIIHAIRYLFCASERDAKNRLAEMK